MTSQKVSLQLVTWNSMKYIADCLSTVFRQTLRDFSLWVIDNSSTDGTAIFIRKHYPEAVVVQNMKNLGFSKAHNQALNLTHSEYVLILNHDTVLTETFLSHLVIAMDTHPKVGCVGGKVFRIHDGNLPAGGDRTRIFDTTGILVSGNRRFVDRGAGEEDIGQYEQAQEVFGISGAIALYRRSALEDVGFAAQGESATEFFDEDFFMYKEDVDLAWRLQLAGWNAWYEPKAVAYHYRGGFGRSERKIRSMLSDRRRKSSFVNGFSYRNHLLMLVKNESRENFQKDWLKIVWYEFQKWLYVVFFEPSTWRRLWQFFTLLPRAQVKRAYIQTRIRRDPSELRHWFDPRV